MKAPDRQKFIDAKKAELSQHETRGNFVPGKKEYIRPGNKLIDMVWSMRRKRRINTQEIYKWKVRLNVHGGQQEYEYTIGRLMLQWLLGKHSESS